MIRPTNVDCVLHSRMGGNHLPDRNREVSPVSSGPFQNLTLPGWETAGRQAEIPSLLIRLGSMF